MLTTSELKQIKHYLELYSKKDSQLPSATTPLNVDDKVAILQLGQNRLVTIKDLFEAADLGDITFQDCPMTDYKRWEEEGTLKLNVVYVCNYDETYPAPADDDTGVMQIYLNSYPFIKDNTKYIYDDNQDKYQKEINQEIYNTLDNLEENKVDKSATYTKEEVDAHIGDSVLVENERATGVENNLSDRITALQTQDIEVVDTLPVSDIDPKKIYRVQGVSSYTDYMYQNDTWEVLATYSFPGIDPTPIAGSENLVKSGGVKSNLDLVDSIKCSDYIAANIGTGSYNKDGSVDNTDTSWIRSLEYTPVRNGDVIIWNGGNSTDYLNNNRKLILYGSNGKVITYYGYTEVNRQITLNYPDVAFIRASFGIGSPCTLYVNGVKAFIAREWNTHVPNKKAADNLYENITRNNKEFVRVNVGDGYISKTDGSIIEDASWCYSSDYIPVKSGDVVVWNGGSTLSEQAGLIIYNSNFDYITYWTYYQQNRQITIEGYDDISYLRASFNKNESCGLTINGKSVFNVCLHNKSISEIDADIQELSSSCSKAIYYDEKTALKYDSMFNIFPDVNTNKFVYDADANYPLRYINVSRGDKIHIRATNNENKNFRWGLSVELPAVGGSLYSLTERLRVMSVDDTVVCDIDGYLFTYCNKDSFTDVTIYIIQEEHTTKEKNIMSFIPLGGFTQEEPQSDWSTLDATTVVSTSAMLVPYYNCNLHFVLPSEFKCKVQYGNIISGTSTSLFTDYLQDGDAFLIPDKVANIRFSIYKTNGGDITPNDVYAAIKTGTLYVWYENETNDVVKKNIGCETYTKAAMYKYTGQAATSFLHNIPVFAHFSDLHGDIVRLKNMLEYCKYLGIDFVVNTGDTVCNKLIDGTKTYHSVVKSYNFPTLICVGNHDDWLLGDSSEGTQNEKIYRSIIEPNSEAFEYNLPDSSDYDDAPTYYYRDFDSLKLRVISINQYEQGIYDWSTYGRISQKQINWFISVLLSTPVDYGIIIAEHVNTATIAKVTGYEKFYQDGSGTTETNLSGNPIGKIIDAFISRTSINGQYTQKIDNNGSMATETISYSADFSSVPNSVEFICHLNGHHHADVIGYYSQSTNIQLCLNITTAQSLYGFVHIWKANDGDIPRGGKGTCEDAFNVCAIDRAAGVVKIARVGSNMTYQLEPRDYMVIPYRDQQNS